VADQFFIRSKGRVEGPFSTDKLRELATRGRFARHYEVSPDGKAWSLAADYPGLFPVPTQRKIRGSGTFQAPIERGTTVVQKIVDVVEETPVQPAETDWYYSKNNESRGPVPFSELERLALAGELLPEDYVWTGGMQGWLPATTAVPTLFFEPVTGLEGSPGSGAQTLQTCRLAIASLTLGLLGMNILLFVGSIAAIVCGHMALKQITQNPQTLTGRGVAILGLILGYVAIAVGVISAAIVITIKITQQKGLPAS
jgi:hypothetical protein